MAIHSFLKAERGDPDWQFTPENYFDKEFKIIEASMIELGESDKDKVVLRQIPTEKKLLAKHLRIHVQRDAMLDMTILNDVDSKIQQVFLYDVHLYEGANLNLGIFAKNGKLNKHIVQVYLEENSNFSAYGLIINDCGGDTEIVTKIAHKGAYSKNTQFFIGIAGIESQTVFQNINLVEPNAKHSVIGTEVSNLIVGEKGRCHSKPEHYVNSEYTEVIQRSDTRIISFDQVGYLTSHGIPENESRKMVINGFKDIILNLVTDEPLKEEISEIYSTQ